MNRLSQELFGMAQARGALLFDAEKGFTLKSGRISPYFFNAGTLQDGYSLAILGAAYAEIIERMVREELMCCDILFGPSYKGIPLVAATAMSLGVEGERVAEMISLSYPFVYNRKEVKTHGEGGLLVGPDVKDKHVVIIDDVITAGTAVEESVRLIVEAGGIPSGLVLILDRQERGKDTPKSAVQEVEERYGFPVRSILTFSDLLSFQKSLMKREIVEKMEVYRAQYGVAD